MLRMRNLFALFVCLLLAAPLLADVVVDPEAFALENIPTGAVFDQPLTLTNEGEQEVGFTIGVEIAEDERLGPQRDRRGGPDDMGYEWRDNLEDDGPEFEWIDITNFQGVRLFNLGDDQNTGALALGWTFPFWGVNYNQIYGNSDAWASFTYTGNNYNYAVQNFPVAVGGAAVMDKTYHFGSVDYGNCVLRYWTNNADMAIIQWWGGGSEQFELILTDDGMAKMQWGPNSQPRNAGVNFGDGRHGWYFGAPAGYIGPGRAIGIGPQSVWVSWIAVEPEEGDIGGGEDFEVSVIFNTMGIEEGNYAATITIETSEDQAIEVPVEMAVLGGAAIFSEDQGHDFGIVYVGTVAEYAVPVENIGQDLLIIDEIVSDNADVFYAEEGDGWEIEAGESRDIHIFCAPADEGEVEGVLTVISNAVNLPEAPFPVRADGFLAPIIDLSTNAIEEDMVTGEVVENVVTVTNEGGAPLEFTVEAEIIDEPGRDRGVRDARSVRNAGPMRDDPGELIAQFNQLNVVNNYTNAVGYDRDNDLVIFNSYTSSFTALWTHDNYENFREVRRWAMPNPMDGAFFDGVILANQHGQAFIHRWDVNGNALQPLPVGFTFYGVAVDPEEGRIFFRENVAPNYDIRVYEYDGGAQLGQLLGRINNYLPMNNNFNPHAIERVPKHPDGQLWLPQTPNLNQIAVNTDNWQAIGRVASYNMGVTQPTTGARMTDTTSGWAVTATPPSASMMTASPKCTGSCTNLRKACWKAAKTSISSLP